MASAFTPSAARRKEPAVGTGGGGGGLSVKKKQDVYCVCRKGHDGEFMLACDSCSEWFHGRCVAIAQDSVPDYYLCPFCEVNAPMTGRHGNEIASKAPPPLLSASTMTTTKKRKNSIQEDDHDHHPRKIYGSGNFSAKTTTTTTRVKRKSLVSDDNSDDHSEGDDQIDDDHDDQNGANSDENHDDGVVENFSHLHSDNDDDDDFNHDAEEEDICDNDADEEALELVIEQSIYHGWSSGEEEEEDDEDEDNDLDDDDDDEDAADSEDASGDEEISEETNESGKKKRSDSDAQSTTHSDGKLGGGNAELEKTDAAPARTMAKSTASEHAPPSTAKVAKPYHAPENRNIFNFDIKKTEVGPNGEITTTTKSVTVQLPQGSKVPTNASQNAIMNPNHNSINGINSNNPLHKKKPSMPLMRPNGPPVPAPTASKLPPPPIGHTTLPPRTQSLVPPPIQSQLPPYVPPYMHVNGNGFSSTASFRNASDLRRPPGGQPHKGKRDALLMFDDLLDTSDMDSLVEDSTDFETGDEHASSKTIAITTKSLLRWDKVPIGAFRRSQRTSKASRRQPPSGPFRINAVKEHI